MFAVLSGFVTESDGTTAADAVGPGNLATTWRAPVLVWCGRGGGPDPVGRGLDRIERLLKIWV